MEELLTMLNEYQNGNMKGDREKIAELARSLDDLSADVSKQLRDIYEKEAERVAKQKTFKDDELIYAAYTRCKCGAGMAYPEGISIHGAWRCSAQLKSGLNGESIDDTTYRTEDGVEHTKDYPFMYYEIKSENQPSANGATTRP